MSGSTSRSRDFQLSSETFFTPQERPHHFPRVFADYLWFEIVKEMTRYLRSSGHYDEPRSDSDRDSLFQLTDRTVDADSTDAVADKCSQLQKEIEDIIHVWSIDQRCTWTPRVDLPSSLGRAVTVLRRLMPRLRHDCPSLCLLFDESSPIPTECQRVINGLLQRGRPYCVKLAIRPYEWSTLETEANRHIELNTDIKPLYMRYPDELMTEYADNMRAVVNKILDTRVMRAGSLPAGWPATPTPDIYSILADGSDDYAGFRTVCAASSGNPQNLLSICSCIFATVRDAGLADHCIDKDNGLQISPRIQREAIIRWSKDYEEQNPYPDSRAFCRSLLKLVRESAESTRSIGFRYSHAGKRSVYVRLSSRRHRKSNQTGFFEWLLAELGQPPGILVRGSV